jgi:hypothetical protein
MADVDRSQTDAEPEAHAPVRRVPYEKPALKHLGSVNRLTLAQSKKQVTDGSRTKPRMPG